MSDVVIVDGVDNNLFDDITDIERMTGRLSLRKVFAAALNADQDTYLSAHVLVDDGPDDVATDAVIFAAGGVTTERAEAVAAFEAWHRTQVTMTECTGASTVAYSGPNTLFLNLVMGTAPQVGQIVGLIVAEPALAAEAHPASYVRAVITGVLNLTSPDYEITLDRSVAIAPLVVTSAVWPMAALDEVRPRGCATAPAGAAGTTLSVDSVYARVVPDVTGGNHGIDPGPFFHEGGMVAVLRAGDAVLVHHTEGMTPAAVANAQVVPVGRSGLARLRVIGWNGVEHARFALGQPPVGSGCTADLTAGTVTFSDVSGYSQPVTVEHRIEELVVISSVVGTTLTLNRALSRAYPAGTKVSSLLLLGDLKGRLTGVAFAQQAWTDQWSDARVGGEPAGDFNIAGFPITCTNKGAVTERWYAQFTNSTSYKVVGEQLGEVGTGNMGLDFAPNNPATSAPYFTIPAAGWGSGWAAGNIYRFNTSGANAPIWVGRCVAPSTPGGDDSVTLHLRGYVNT